MINAEQLNAIRERAAKSTPGPWYHNRHNEISTPNGARLAQTVTGLDAEFIAHVREDVPALVAEVERYHDMWYHGLGKADAEIQTNLHVIEAQQQEIERLRKALEFYADDSQYVTQYDSDFNGRTNAHTPIKKDSGKLAREALAIGEESNAL